MINRIPDNAYVLIIGAMKSGTTSLFDYLRSHPEICPAMVKEPEFFSENQAHSKKVNSYDELWSFDSSVHKYALEASTGYSKYPYEKNVPGNIHHYGITPKFIYIIRNPYDRITSHYNFFRHDRSFRIEINDPNLIHLSNYFLQLEQYRKYFPVENFLILDFDELNICPSLVLQKIYRFLGLSGNHFPESYKALNTTPLESELERTLRELNRGNLFGFIPHPIKRLVKKIVRVAHPPSKYVLSAAEKELIHDKLNADMINLYRCYGFDVRKWGFAI